MSVSNSSRRSHLDNGVWQLRRGRRRFRTTLGMGALVAMLAMPAPALAATVTATITGSTYVVNTTDDNDDSVCDGTHCSLREAINAANVNTDHDLITFDIPDSGVQTINTSGLPTATNPVSIDGTTQPGYAGTPVVEVITSSDTGLRLNGAGSLVRGLAIGNSSSTMLFPSSGLVLAGSGITVEDNHLNLDAVGATVSTFNIGLDVYSGGHRIVGNVIASNNYSVLIRGGGAGTGGNEIVGNLIGTDATGTIGLSNPDNGPGIELRVDSGGNLIHGNVISSHRRGLTIDGSSNNVITGNFIGTDVTGTVDLGNSASGVGITGTGNRVGGTTAADRNVISGNGEPNHVGTGIGVGGTDNVVLGNYIGTDATGMNPLPNARGVQVQQGTGIVIGGSGAGEGNVISANYENGLQFSFEASGSRAQGNLIGVATDGTTPLGNGNNGVTASGLFDGTGVLVGGASAGEGNVIAHNGSSGVFVSSTSRYVSVLGNSIHHNGLLGIDLVEPWGVTPNDGGTDDDADTGGNDLVNFPVLTAVTPGTTDTTVDGYLDGAPNTTFRVEVFSSEVCDASGHGEGATFLGSETVSTDGAGEANFQAVVTTPAPASAITATATDSAGNTSEFSACVLDPREAASEPEPGSVTIVKQTDPAGGTGFTFTGPSGATPAGNGTLGSGGDTVVFYRDSEGLFFLDVATGTETFLPGTAGARDPEFSPDSSKIAFDGPSTTLGVFDVASETIDVLVDTLHASHPSWSPDGNWIVFHASSDLWAVPSDGSEAPTQLTDTEFKTESFPVWGPDGRIAWRTNATTPNVRVATFDVTTKSLAGEAGLGSLPSQHRAMHWSPDGTQLAAGAAVDAASDTDLYVLADDGSGTWTATQLTAESPSYDTDPTWTPDGSRIIYRGQGDSSVDLFSVPADGSESRTLFYAGTGNEAGPDWGQVSTTSEYILDDGDSIGGLVPAGESVTFAELASEDYVLASILCDSPSAVIDGASASVTVTPEEGEAVTCTFTNVPSLLDSDGDGIPDIIEIWLGCDPHAKDSDGDGLDDGTELWLGTDPTMADSDPSDGFASDLEWANAQIGGAISDPNGDGDGDGVPDIGELFHGTDPDSPDSDEADGYANDFDFLTATTGSGTGDHDGDGLPNGAEGLWGIYWDQADSDGNGQNDVIYIIHSCPAYPTCYPEDEGMQEQVDRLLGISAGAPDSDSDGLSDPFEELLRTDPNDPDTDGDGWTDLEELVNGTPPAASLGACASANSWDPVPLGEPITLCVDLGGPGPFTGGFDWGDGSSDTTSDAGEFTKSHTYAEPGVYKVICEIEDANGARHEVEHLVVVYDPDGGFVTGGGWINSPAGAYAADPDLTGKATFGFVSKYKKGATIPTGNTDFQFKAGDLNFHSASYEWLVVSGANAKYKGVGTINGTGDYGFMLTATDSAINGGGTVDTFRIKIWNRADGDAVVYDNKMGESDDSDAGTALGGGNIVIHTKK